jgi:hypothetical protein
VATTRKAKEPQQTATDTTAAVDEFMSSLEHPQKAVVEAIRGLMLSVGDSVREGLKWNAPSYRTHEYFATTNLRSRMGVGVILHFGAKVRPLPASGVNIDDPANGSIMSSLDGQTRRNTHHDLSRPGWPLDAGGVALLVVDFVEHCRCIGPRPGTGPGARAFLDCR